MELLFFILAVFLAAIVQGATGFGFGLVALAVFSMFVNIRDASVLIALPALSLNLLMLWRLRSHLYWRGIGPILLGVVVGAPLGVFFLKKADATLLNTLLGVVLVVSAVYSLIPQLAKRRWHPVYLGVPAGLLSGTLTGAFGTGGPPLVAFVSTQGYDRFRYAVTVQLLLATAAVIRLEELLRADLLKTTMLPGCAIAIVFAMVGGILGLSILKRLSNKLLRRIVAVILLGMGVWKLVLCPIWR